MRFRKEDKVEVMNKDEAVTSWRCGEIISGNGHTYSVRYDCYSGLKREDFVERVPRKVIRPCPPHAEVSERWMVGDIVEVFDDQSWKTASILKVNGGDYYLVRILGSCQEFRVHKLNIRIRLSWESDEWVVIGKLSGNCGDLKSSKLSTSNCYKKTSFQAPHANAKMNLQKGEICLAVQKKGGLQESQMVSSRMLKRASPYCSSILEAYTGNVKKTRAIEGEGWDRRVGPTPLLEKGQSWRHASLCFQSCKDDAGICHLPLGTNSGTISAFTFDQIRQPMISLFNLVFGPSFALSKFENAPMI